MHGKKNVILSQDEICTYPRTSQSGLKTVQAKQQPPPSSAQNESYLHRPHSDRPGPKGGRKGGREGGGRKKEEEKLQSGQQAKSMRKERVRKREREGERVRPCEHEQASSPPTPPRHPSSSPELCIALCFSNSRSAKWREGERKYRRVVLHAFPPFVVGEIFPVYSSSSFLSFLLPLGGKEEGI